MLAERARRQPVQAQQLERLPVLPRGDLDLVAALAQQCDQGPEDEHVRGRRQIDPDPHRVTLESADSRPVRRARPPFRAWPFSSRPEGRLGARCTTSSPLQTLTTKARETRAEAG